MNMNAITCGSVLAAACVTASLTAASIADGVYDGYMNHDALSAAVKELAGASDACALNMIGESGQGRDIYQLTLSGAGNDADSRPAMLIVAGLDGRHLVGTETALRVARQLLAEHRDLLDELTFYIIPRVNPDGAEENLGPVNAGFIGTLTDVDTDRDDAMNENGPQDLNGDGVITQMRRPNPPLDDRPQYMADPVEPRLLKKPDADKGETAIYSLYVEGLDTDDDGSIAEDGPGVVDLDKNFMHQWPEYDRDSGIIPLSEPEAKALATFVIAHENIVAAITYGRHDNLVNKPDSRGRDVSGRGPREIDGGDASIYEEIGKLFKDVTGQKRAPKEDTAGSFEVWLYAQRGIPSFATVVWGRPDPSKPAEEKAGDNGDGAAERNESAPQAGEENGEGEQRPPREGRREGRRRPGGSPPVEAGESTPEATGVARPVAPATTDPVTGVWRGTANIPEMGELDITLDLTRDEDNKVTGQMDTPMGGTAINGTFDPGSGAISLVAQFGPEVTVPIELTAEGEALRGTVTDPEGNNVQFTAKRVSGGEKPAVEGARGNGKKEDKPADEEAAEWLKYSDHDRGGAGFIEWSALDHPTLGQVEIGGFVPGFQMNPPADELDDLAGKETEFIVKLTEKLPKMRVEGPEVKKLATGLYDVRLAVINDGWLPTKTAMARKARSIKPTVVRMSVPVDHIVAGDRVDRIWGLDGSGGRSVHHWIINADDGSEITINLLNTQLGNRTIRFNAVETSSN